MASRMRVLLCLLALLTIPALRPMVAQQPARPAASEDDNFTGKAFRLESNTYALSRRGFEAAARSNWHTHQGGQLLLVESGAMRVQVEGQAMKELRQGDSILLAGGSAHWHGAAPAQPATQLSVTMGPGIKWMEKVTDGQYAGTAKR